MKLPAGWNRPRATAIGATLLLHVVLAAVLLSLRFELPPELPETTSVIYPQVPREPPRVSESLPELPPPRTAPMVVSPRPEPVPAVVVPPFYDFESSARAVAKAIGDGPSRRTFGDHPQAPPTRPKEVFPPSIWPKLLPRVGTTVTSAEGETILWVSDNCWVSLGSTSLTLQHIHQARQGVRMCQIGAGKKAVRGDLFDAIKRPPKPQEPGCDKEGIGLSCGR